MGEKKKYWFCVLSDSNTKDRKTCKKKGVGSGAGLSLVKEPEGDGGGGGGPRGVEEHRNYYNAMRLSRGSDAQSNTYIISPFFSGLNGRVNKSHYCTDRSVNPPSPHHHHLWMAPPAPPSGHWLSMSDSAALHSWPAFPWTPSCSLLSCNQISLLDKHAGSRQEEEDCFCVLSPSSSSLVGPAVLRQDGSTFFFFRVNVTQSVCLIVCDKSLSLLGLFQHWILQIWWSAVLSCFPKTLSFTD